MFLHGLAIEAAGDLLSGSNGEVATGDFNESAPLELVLQQLALGLRTLQDGISA